jgi:MFS family permease
LLLLKLPPYRLPTEKKKITTELSAGFSYLKKTPSISMIILMISAISLLVLPYDTLLPVFAKVVFRGDAVTFGYIYSFIGAGAIAGTFFLASLRSGTNLKIVLLVNTIIFGFGLMLFSRVSFFPVAMLFAMLSGFGSMSQGTICITIIQVNANANMRGRMISYLAMAMFGMLPLGSLLIGIISQHIGAPNAMFCQGVMALIVAALFSNFLRTGKFSKQENQGMEEAEDLAIEKI